MKPAQKIIHFFCWTCREYHLKTHAHYRTQRRRLARRKTARRAEAEQKEDSAE